MSVLGLGPDTLAELGLISPGWARELHPVAAELARIGAFLDTEDEVLPREVDILRALRGEPADVRVLVIGQDPYPTPGHAMGLAFSAEPHVHPLPRSVANIFRELREDIGAPLPDTADLSAWSERGVMLLNRVLTVRPGEAGSHRKRGWEAITDHVVTVLAARDVPLVGVLWGRDAQAVAPLLGDTAVVTGVHPSPLSAARGFFGSRPFSAVNALLIEQGAEPIDWSLPSTEVTALF